MKEKRRLNTATLEKNAIWYFKNVRVISASYPQASLVAEGLLDFERILSQTSFNKLGKGSQMMIDEDYKSSKIPKFPRSTVGKDRYEEKYQVAAHEARFDLALRIARISRDIVSAKEARWSAVVKYELFGNLIRSSRQEEGLRIVDTKRNVEKVRIEEEDVWEHGRRCLRRTAPPNAPPLTAPKADLYIALPIFSKDFTATGFHKDDCIKNFTQDNLTRLEKSKNGNLISNPITPMLDTLKDITEKHLVCFPSTVVEIKHHKVNQSEIRKCYAQAANASATALSMLGRLSHLSIPSHAVGEIQPVVAFTFIGNKFRVWVTHIVTKCDASNTSKMLFEYEMCCIFKGDLKSVWDTLRLCCIIERVHHWTVRHFRPWVSSCLSRWRWAVSEDINHKMTWIGKLADLKKKDDNLSSKEDQLLRGDYLELYEEVSDEDKNTDDDEDPDSDEDSDSDEDGELEYEPSDEGGISLSEEESAIETEEDIELDVSPTIRFTPPRRGASRQDRSEGDAKDSPSRSKATPTRVTPHRNAKMVSPEAPAKTRAPLPTSKSDSLTLPIRKSKSHARSHSTGNINDL
ncbi:hypothetical protein B0J14DRAFT_584240 [Halenospora varia]|nr:hypothetical protein B0J14DRAFT_584240 [Halenospora varia]